MGKLTSDATNQKNNQKRVNTPIFVIYYTWYFKNDTPFCLVKMIYHLIATIRFCTQGIISSTLLMYDCRNEGFLYSSS